MNAEQAKTIARLILAHGFDAEDPGEWAKNLDINIDDPYDLLTGIADNGRYIPSIPDHAIDVDRQAVDALKTQTGVQDRSPAEAFVLGYRAAWPDALEFLYRLEDAIGVDGDPAQAVA